MHGISCIVCTYNEGQRLREILQTIEGHPALKEIVVVNDGSTDDTDTVVRNHPRIRRISYIANRGKTYAMSRGIAAATGEYLMFLDADLAGLCSRDIGRLAEPVTSGRADVSISLRRNSLSVYRCIGLDFVSGERVIPAWLVRDQLAVMSTLPRWGAETFINQLIIDRKLRIEVVDWSGVSNIRKFQKVGAVRGLLAELQMVADALRVLTPIGLVLQIFRLLKLVNRRK